MIVFKIYIDHDYLLSSCTVYRYFQRFRPQIELSICQTCFSHYIVQLLFHGLAQLENMSYYVFTHQIKQSLFFSILIKRLLLHSLDDANVFFLHFSTFLVLHPYYIFVCRVLIYHNSFSSHQIMQLLSLHIQINIVVSGKISRLFVCRVLIYYGTCFHLLKSANKLFMAFMIKYGHFQGVHCVLLF